MIAQHYETREYIYPVNRNTLYLKLYLNSKDNYEVSIIYWKRFHEYQMNSSLMINRSIDGNSPYFTGIIEATEPIHYIRYYFKLSNLKETLYYTPWGIETDQPQKFFEYMYVNSLDLFTEVKSFQGKIGYHLFLDRFYNGNPLNDPSSIVPWDTIPTRENFFGGDLEGLRQKLPYLLDLKIDVLFLLPIFKSHSNHKYDTVDYFEIDEAYGTIDEFKSLVNEIHSHGMKIVLDGVFNHIGYYSSIFQDVINKGIKSIYYDWFYIRGEFVDTEKVNYECVGDYKWMPKLNYASKSLREYIINVGKYWIEEAHIDGWRLDVADEVDYTFWCEFRRELKPLNENLILVAETWKDGKDLLRGDQMDSVMNYKLRELIINFLTHDALTVKRLNNRIEKLFFEYPMITHNVLYNHVSSHDTERVITALHNNQSLLKLAILMQMTLPGLPVIYYGDEVGIDGENDPLCRKTMNWDLINNDIHLFTKSLIELRKSTLALSIGEYKSVFLDFNIYSFLRIYDNEAYLILINRYEKDAYIVFHPADYFKDCKVSNDKVEINTKVAAFGYKLIKMTYNNSLITTNIL
ncbi:MAG: hypothetical protein CVV56_05020 [Tenericutes bacterium HGW-Tenericutes-1]|jgi:glycosidase|nr:MAG: hypothetical protein CVV56_05020 [Tenericutes bacterium HGW-Tenericutes-1]